MADKGPTLEVVGAADAFAAVGRLVDKYAGEVDDEGRHAAERVVEATAAKVPRVSGRLVGSLGVDAELGGAAAGYDGSAPYDAYVEFGGSHGRPYRAEGRYLYPSAKPVADTFADDLEALLDDDIRRHRWPTPR